MLSRLELILSDISGNHQFDCCQRKHTTRARHRARRRGRGMPVAALPEAELGRCLCLLRIIPKPAQCKLACVVRPGQNPIAEIRRHVFPCIHRNRSLCPQPRLALYQTHELLNARSLSSIRHLSWYGSPHFVGCSQTGA